MLWINGAEKLAVFIIGYVFREPDLVGMAGGCISRMENSVINHPIRQALLNLYS